MDNLPNTGAGMEISLLSELERKSLSGIGLLVKRQIGVRLLSFLANIALARLLVPQVFGVYAIVVFIVQFFSTFGDVGIGAALIQKKGELSSEDLSSTFWLQQVLVCCVVCVVFAAAPLALCFYPTLPTYGVWLIRAMAVSFALASLKTIPTILMERELNFSRIALVDIIETVSFYATAILLALTGFDVWSFIIAALTRAFSGTVLIYLFSSWRPSRVFRLSAVKDLVRFGLPYQANSVIGFVKDSVTPVFIGAYAGAAAVGFVNMAKSLALAPLMLSEAFGRVAFPAFSRIQDERALLGRAVERSIRCITLVMFPVTALMLALGPEIIRVVFTPKWLPGLMAYYFYCTSPLVIGVVLPMYSAILSLGKSSIILQMMVSLAVLEWGLGVPFVLLFGFNGIAFSQPVTAGLFYFVYKRVLKSENVHISLLKNTWWQLSAATAAAFLCRIVGWYIPESAGSLLFLGFSGLAIYVCILLAAKNILLEEFMEQVRKVVGGVEGK